MFFSNFKQAFFLSLSKRREQSANSGKQERSTIITIKALLVLPPFKSVVGSLLVYDNKRQ